MIESLRKSFLVVALFLMFLPFVVAFQINSLNYSTEVVTSSGGDNLTSGNYSTDIVVGIITGESNSTSYQTFLGFFYGLFEGSVCGDGTCDSDEDCSSCVTDCGCSSGYTCSAGICTVIPSSDSPPEEGSGGSSSSSPAVSVSQEYLFVTPTDLSVNLAVNTNKEKSIFVENIGTTARNFSVSQEGLGNSIIFEEESFYLGAGETKELKVFFVAFNETGIFTGKIKIGNKEVLVSLNVRTKLLLFDSQIIVLNEDYRVEQGKDLETKVNLIPMGEEERLDVTLNYLIKDYDGKTYLTHSETLLVTEKIDFGREFATGNLPVGNYIVGLELIYPNGIATSSAHFEIYKNDFPIFFLILLFLSLIIVIFVIIFIIFLIKRNADGEIRSERFYKPFYKRYFD